MLVQALDGLRCICNPENSVVSRVIIMTLHCVLIADHNQSSVLRFGPRGPIARDHGNVRLKSGLRGAQPAKIRRAESSCAEEEWQIATEEDRAVL